MQWWQLNSLVKRSETWLVLASYPQIFTSSYPSYLWHTASVANQCCRGMCSFQPGPSRPLSQCLVDLCLLSLFSHVGLFATLWTVACQAPQSLGFSRQEYWSCHALFQVIFPTQGWTHISCIAGRFFTDWATREALLCGQWCLKVLLFNPASYSPLNSSANSLGFFKRFS